MRSGPQNGIRYAIEIMKHYTESCTSSKCPERSSFIRSRTSNCWHRPVVLGDTRPEDPHHDHCEQGEQGFEEAAVDLAIGAITKVNTDNVLEDLRNSEEDSCANKID